MSEDIRVAVRDRYGRIANDTDGCCGRSACDCGSAQLSTRYGYTFDELSALPDGADLALGCGNPTALAEISEGETVVDLGSGGGIDCFLAARKAGLSGRVIGVDMTPEMIDKARKGAEAGGYDTVEFRLGEIENLPIADESVDVIISNCVINLSPDKSRVFSEAFRVLRPGGRLMVSDIVLTKSLDAPLRRSVDLITGCVAAALEEAEYLERIRSAGFDSVDVQKSASYGSAALFEPLLRDAGLEPALAPELAGAVRSVTVRAQKR